jgi:hypothetical protein
MIKISTAEKTRFEILRDFLPVFFGHFAVETHFIQRPLVSASGALHDRRQEGLGVEKSSQPHSGRKLII